MAKFLGFDIGESGEKRFTGVPSSFFTRLLPQITNLSEMKVTLYAFYLAGQKKGEPKWIGYWELAEDEDLLNGLRRSGDPRPPEEHLREGLELALTRGTLIRLLASPAPQEFFQGPGGSELEPVMVTWFLLNTAANRDFITRLETGQIQIENTSLLQGLDLWDLPLPGKPRGEGEEEVTEATLQIQEWQRQRLPRLKLQTQRPDIYTLYEQNIGPLTPILSERLHEAEKLYPAEWVQAAFSEAVNYNRRSWAYISRILENWATDGRDGQERREKDWNDTRGSNGRRPPVARAGTRPPGPPANQPLSGPAPAKPTSAQGKRGGSTDVPAPGSSPGQLIQWRGAEAERKRQQHRKQQRFQPEDPETQS